MIKNAREEQSLSFITPELERLWIETQASFAAKGRSDDAEIEELMATMSKRVTREEIMAKRTLAGGWTAAQLAEWGVSWPPRKGWINRLAGGAPRAPASTGGHADCGTEVWLESWNVRTIIERTDARGWPLASYEGENK